MYAAAVPVNAFVPPGPVVTKQANAQPVVVHPVSLGSDGAGLLVVAADIGHSTLAQGVDQMHDPTAGKGKDCIYTGFAQPLKHIIRNFFHFIYSSVRAAKSFAASAIL